MRETMADFMAVWAQSANAYRRYVPKAYVSHGGALGLQQSHRGACAFPAGTAPRPASSIASPAPTPIPIW